MPDVMIRNGVVKCRAKSGDFIACKPLELYECGQQCGNCPLIAFADRFTKIYFGV
jgi:hypothetical protein